MTKSSKAASIENELNEIIGTQEDLQYSNNQEIIFIEINKLIEHEKQTDIYGKTDVDEEFVESIRIKGILQPILVSFRQIDGKNVIISGHRRTMGAYLAGNNVVPCIIKYYENIDDEIADLVISNKMRVKNNHQKSQEFLVWNQILCQIKEVRKLSDTSADSDFENSNFWTLVQKHQNLLNGDLSSREALAKILNVSEREIKYLNAIVTDEYRNKQIEILNSKLAEKGFNLTEIESITNQLFDYIDIIRKDCDTEQITLKEGYDKIIQGIKELTDLEPKGKKKIKVVENPEPKPKLQKYDAQKAIQKIFALQTENIHTLHNWNELTLSAQFDAENKQSDIIISYQETHLKLNYDEILKLVK